MGNSASIRNLSYPQDFTPTRGTRLFNSAVLKNICTDCNESQVMSEAFARHIKDGTWIDRLGARTPSFFKSPQSVKLAQKDYLLPRKKTFILTKPNESSNLSITEQRLLFLSAIAEDFLKHGDNSIMKITNVTKSQETFQSDDSYIFREEVYKVEELLLRPAMYFDEENYTRFLTETAWIRDLPPLMDNLPVPLLILDTHSDSTEKNFTTSDIVYANKSWEKMMKLNFEDIENKSFEEVMFCSQSEEEQINLLSNAVESAHALKLGITCQRKNGDLFLNLMVVVPIVTDSQGTFRFVGILHCDASNEKEFDKHLSIADEIMPLLPFIIKTPRLKCSEVVSENSILTMEGLTENETSSEF